MNWMQVFSRRSLWTVALYRLDSPGEVFEVARRTPVHFFGAQGLRTSRAYQSTTADPFLFAHDGRLYIFFEVKTDFGHGEIWAESMGADGAWVNHGCVLAEPFHVSYPNVFQGPDGRIYMLPETAASGKAWLYTTDAFPFDWRKVGVLLDQILSDPAMIFTPEGVLLLGTTRQDELKVHAAPGPEGPFNPQGQLITRDRAISRSGGAPFMAGGKLHRPAQNCTTTYGQNISIMEVELIGSSDYRERLLQADLYPSRQEWMELGYHHMSLARFGDHYFLAVDGRRRDRYVNTLLLAWFKCMGR